MVLPDRRSVNFYTSILRFAMTWKRSVETTGTNSKIIGLLEENALLRINSSSYVMILRKLGRR